VRKKVTGIFKQRECLIEFELARDLQVKERKFAIKSARSGIIDGFFLSKNDDPNVTEVHYGVC
jgi:hypothetical protein